MIPIKQNIPFAELPMEIKNKMQDLKDWQIVEIVKTTDNDGYLCYNVIQVNGHLVYFINALKTSYDDEWFFINQTYSLAYLDGLKKAKEFWKEGKIMARSILILGESGAGKTTSLRTLDPKTTFIFDADKKGENWRGWKKDYNTQNKNYIATSDANIIFTMLKRMNDGDLKHIKVAVIDTLNGVMIDDEFKRMREKSFDKWQDLAASIYRLISDIHDLREDLTVVCIAHTQTDRDDNGYFFTHMKTSGRKLDKIVPESKFTVVLLAKGDNGKYIFETSANHSTAKAPMGMFENKEIPNDMKSVIDTMIAYDEG